MLQQHNTKETYSIENVPQSFGGLYNNTLECIFTCIGLHTCTQAHAGVNARDTTQITSLLVYNFKVVISNQLYIIHFITLFLLINK